MRRKLTAVLVSSAAIGAVSLMPAGASAAHCISPDGSSPGFSYFGTVHVQSSAHDREGGNPGPHAGTSGASNCRETTGSPSDRSRGGTA